MIYSTVADSANARLSASISKSGRAQASRITFSRRVMRVDRRGQRARHGLRHDHRAVAVGVDEIAVAHAHAVNVDRAAEIDDVDMGVTGADFAGQQLETGRQHIQIADRAVGDAAQAAERLMHSGVDLAPPGAEAGTRIDVLGSPSPSAPGLALRIRSRRRAGRAFHRL